MSFIRMFTIRQALFANGRKLLTVISKILPDLEMNAESLSLRVTPL